MPVHRVAGASAAFTRLARALVAAASLAAAAGAASGCAQSAGAKMAEDVSTLRDERTPQKLLLRGKAFAEVGDFTRAEQYLSAALDAGADEALPLLLRVCIDARRFRVAIDYAEPVLRKHPADSKLRFVVAALYRAVGDIHAARVALEEVAAKEPDAPLVHYQLATLLRDETGARLEADRHFREYLRLAPTGDHAEEARAALLKELP